VRATLTGYAYETIPIPASLPVPAPQLSENRLEVLVDLGQFPENRNQQNGDYEQQELENHGRKVTPLGCGGSQELWLVPLSGQGTHGIARRRPHELPAPYPKTPPNVR